jgi:hypothetical protein
VRDCHLPLSSAQLVEDALFRYRLSPKLSAILLHPIRHLFTFSF